MKSWRQNLVGKRFDKLVVMSFDHNKKYKNHISAFWKCKCDCGNEKIIRYDLLKYRPNRSCGCSPHRQHTCGRKSLVWKGCGDIIGHHFAHIRNQAKIRSLEFNLTIEYLWELFKNQNQKCNLTDLPLSFVSNKIQSRTASLDRIDNDKGYIEGNVQWIHKDINYMKRTLSQTRLIDYCRLIINKHPNNA